MQGLESCEVVEISTQEHKRGIEFEHLKGSSPGAGVASCRNLACLLGPSQQPPPANEVAH